MNELIHGYIPNCRLFIGDCIETLRNLEARSIHCCVTSPPYFGLRDYGHDGQIGLEESPDEYVAALVEVFREVRRVLRDDGTVWLNLGDSYSNIGKTGGYTSGVSAKGNHGEASRGCGNRSLSRSRTLSQNGLKPKDLIGIPWRVAFALQADGWYLRQDIIWHKPNPMPESVTDRCTKAHEYIFLLSKGPKYYYDHEAVKEPVCSDRSPSRKAKRSGAGHLSLRPNGSPYDGTGDKRNRRSVWTVTARPYKGAHFATFPPDLIEPCILAGCPEGGTVLDPFAGSGTTAAVALKHDRNALLCELSSEYADLVEGRIEAIIASKS